MSDILQPFEKNKVMLHFDDIVFGPIVSRRLGSSLGVNLLPSKGKLCNFDCIYCECGWNKDGAGDRVFPKYEDIEKALEEKMTKLSSEDVQVDSITFSGNGEPTMHPDFPAVIDLTLRLRDRFYPDAKVSVLSNATLLGRKPIAEALMRVDNPILKIDGSSDELICKINKPVASYKLAEVVDNLKKFEGRFVLQTMFLKSQEFSTTGQEDLNRWMDIVRELKPREVMVYTIDRETPDKTLEKYSVEEMQKMVQPLVDEGFKVQIRG